KVQIKKVERFVCRSGKSLRCRRCHSVNILWQGRVHDRRNSSLSEVIIIQPENPGVRPEPQLVRPVAPRQVVIDKESRSPPSLNPRIVQSSDGSERRIRSASLQHDWKDGKSLRKIRGPE